MGSKDLRPEYGDKGARPGEDAAEDIDTSFNEIDLLKYKGTGDLYDLDLDSFGSLEVRPEDAGGLI